MSERIEKISFEPGEKDYRTEIPNIVYELMHQGLISPSAFLLYCTYRRIAGEKGECFVGTRKLAESLKCSTKTITAAKRELSKSQEILKEKSLIRIEPGNRMENEADSVFISNIWVENILYFQVNHSYFKNKTTCVPGKTGVCSKENRGVFQGTQKNEPTKKEPLKKVSNPEPVDKFQDSLSDFVDSLSPAAGSSPSSKEEGKDTSFLSPELEEILILKPQLLPHIREKNFAIWIKKFGPLRTLRTLEYFLEKMKSSKKKIGNPEAWIEKAFQAGYAEVDEQEEINKKFAQNLKKEKDWSNLKIQKRYCQDTFTGKDFYYNLPTHTFQSALRDSERKRR